MRTRLGSDSWRRGEIDRCRSRSKPTLDGGPCFGLQDVACVDHSDPSGALCSGPAPVLDFRSNALVVEPCGAAPSTTDLS